MSGEDLKDAIKEMLIDCNEYYNLKARLEQIVYEKVVSSSEPKEKPKKTKDVELADALVADYLSWRGCNHARSVFLTEGIVGQELLKSDLQRDLKITEYDNEIPILLAILRNFQDGGNKI